MALVVAHTIHGVLQSIIWQCFQVERREHLPARIALLADADEVARLVAIDDLVVAPGAIVLLQQPRAFTAQEVRNILLVNVLGELFEGIAADNLYFLSGFLV